MRKKILAILPVGMMALSLTGCGSNSSAKLSAEVDQLAEKYVLTRATGIGLEEANRVYTVSHTVDSLTIPADHSITAARLDELNVMRPNIQAAYSNPVASAGQKAILGRMLAEIDLSNAYYRSDRAQVSYDRATNGTTGLQAFANKVDALIGVITILRGDRDVIIDTLQTGNLGDAAPIDGVDQLKAHAEAIQERLDQARAAYEEFSAQARTADDLVLTNDQLELELRTDANLLSGEQQFDVLNQAILVWLDARLAEIKSEYNGLRASAAQQTAELNQSDLATVEQVIEQLQGIINGIRTEIRDQQDKVRSVQGERDDAKQMLDDAFRAVAIQMDTMVFERLELATADAQSAVQLYGAMNTTGQAREAMQHEHLNAMLVQLQVHHQHAVAISGYKSTIDALIVANGQDVLGANLAGDLASLSNTLDTTLSAIKADAQEVQQSAADLVGTLLNSAGSQTQAATLLAEQSARIEAIRTGLADLPFESQ